MVSWLRQVGVLLASAPVTGQRSSGWTRAQWGRPGWSLAALAPALLPWRASLGPGLSSWETRVALPRELRDSAVVPYPVPDGSAPPSSPTSPAGRAHGVPLQQGLSTPTETALLWKVCFRGGGRPLARCLTGCPHAPCNTPEHTEGAAQLYDSFCEAPPTGYPTRLASVQVMEAQAGQGGLSVGGLWGTPALLRLGQAAPGVRFCSLRAGALKKQVSAGVQPGSMARLPAHLRAPWGAWGAGL